MDAILTAAGKNSRMIDDFRKMNMKPTHKLKLKINNKEILLYTIDNLLKSKIDNIILCVGHHKETILDILEENNIEDKIQINVNPDVNVGLSKTIKNALQKDLEKNYLFMAADQPTVLPETINKLIDTLENSPSPKNTISVLARRKYGKLDSAEGLGMPFCCYGKLLYQYVKNENDNLNPILRKMIKNNVDFYGIKEKNKLELLNINHLADYQKIKKVMEENYI